MNQPRIPDTPVTQDGAPPRPAPLPLGELLVREGLVGEEDIAHALAVQKNEKDHQGRPLGHILVKTGVLSEQQVHDLLRNPELRRQIGSLAVEKGFLEQSQLASCLEDKKEGRLIGQVLVERGHITRRDLRKLIEEQTNAPRFGELAVKLGMITPSDLKEALRIQGGARKLGEILCDKDLLNPRDLQNVLNKYNKQIEIGKLLLDMGFISEDQLREARQENPWGTETLGETLLRKGLITQVQLKSALSRQFNVPFRRLEGFAYLEADKTGLHRIISQKFAEKNLILPITLKGNELTLAVLHPETMLIKAYELQGMYPHLKVACVLITEQKFEELFEVLYSRHLHTGIQAKNEEEADVDIDFMAMDMEEGLDRKTPTKPEYETRDAEAEEIVNFILKYGIVNGASDIHIEQDRKGVSLRYRLDGILRESRIGWLQHKLREKTPSIISRIKVMANLDITEKRMPQDGGFRIHYHDKSHGERVDLDFRVATCRATVGENVTIRILDPRKANVDLADLNHSPHVLKPFQSLLKSPSGMILVCGPTGSGKTSTLYAALRHIYNPGLKIITAEDPVEYNFPGIMQTQVNAKIHLTFSRLLRSFLRSDPDVMLIGEIRDEETAKIAFDAVQTGHLLLSTLHTNDAVSSVSRLLDLKVEYGQIASSLMCVLSQRLVRKNCPSCLQESTPEENEWNMLFQQYPSHLRFFQGKGCAACSYSGYLGRTVLSEIFLVDGEVVHALNHGYEEGQIRKVALECGMRTMIDDGLGKLQQTTLSEIIRMVPHDMITAFRARQRTQEEVDLILETMGEPSRKEVSEDRAERIRITSPESERAKIDLLQASFEKLRHQSGDGQSGALDPVLFKEFITASHARICNEYGCSQVAFDVSINSGTGRAEVSAEPEN